MSTLIEEGTVGAFIIYEGPAVQMSREQATVVALGPLKDGEPLCENDGEAEADYQSWREAGYPRDNLPTALLIGAIDAPADLEDGTVYRSALLCGHAVVSTEAVEALLNQEEAAVENWYLLWASLYQRSAIVSTPAPDNRASLSYPIGSEDVGAATPVALSFEMNSDGVIDATFEGCTIRAVGEGAAITLTLPLGLVNRRLRIVNDRIAQTIVIYPDSEEYIKGGVPGNSDAVNGTTGFGRMYQGAAFPDIPAGAYIDLIGTGDGWRVLEVATVGDSGIVWNAAGF